MVVFHFYVSLLEGKWLFRGPPGDFLSLMKMYRSCSSSHHIGSQGGRISAKRCFSGRNWLGQKMAELDSAGFLNHKVFLAVDGSEIPAITS